MVILYYVKSQKVILIYRNTVKSAQQITFKNIKILRLSSFTVPVISQIAKRSLSQVYQRLDHRSRTTDAYISLIFFLIYQAGGEQCEIWLQFLTAVASEVPTFRNETTWTYQKSENELGSTHW